MKKKLVSLIAFALALVMAMTSLPVGAVSSQPEISQAAFAEEESGRGVISPMYTTGDTYPANLKNAPKDSIIDPWNFYNRECTSFAAWCLNDRNGVGFTNQYLGAARWGHAKTWGTVAQGLGVAVNNNPAVGSIAWWNTGTYGHVAWVSAVNGSSVTIEEYNYASAGNWGTRTISSSSPTGYIHIKDLQTAVYGSEMTSGYDRVLPDGNYIIANAGSSDKLKFMYLDIAGGDHPAGYGSNVQIYGPGTNIGYHDVWSITYSNGFYTIKQPGTDVALDVPNFSKLSGENVQVARQNYGSAQQWAISKNGRNGYRLQAKCSGFSLDVKGGGAVSGTNVQQWQNNDSDAQSWLFIPYEPSQPIQNGRYILLSGIADGWELDVEGNTGNFEGYANVQLWDDTADSRYNSFDITKLENGYYSIIHAASGKALDVSNGLSTYNTNIVVQNANGTIAQQWAITPNGNGYMLRARCNGFTLDVEYNQSELEGGNFVNGRNVLSYPYHGRANQTWRFVPAEHTVSYNANGGTGAPSAQTKYYKTDLILSSAVPNRDGYTFVGWATSSSGTTAYQPADTYTNDADMTLYALWEENATPEPIVTPNPDEPQIIVDTKTVLAGSTVTVDVSLLNNPGIVSMALTVDFDERIELVSVTDSGLIPGQVHSPTMGNPYVLCWVNDTATENFTGNGVIATLTFEVPEDMPVGEYPITISYDLDNYDIYNCDVELVDFAVVNGKVNVIDVLIGDVNTDTKVNALDRLYLTRFLAKWADYPEAVINMIAADVNVDTKVNALDRLILTRYLAKWAGYETLPYSAKSAPEAKKAETKGSEPTIVVDSVTAEPGETVTVCVSLENNPGIVSMMLTVDFDQALELIGRTDTGLLPGQVHSPNLNNPYTLCWVNDTATTNYTVNGAIVELTFKLSENAEPGTYPITISYDLDNYDIYNCDVELVEFEVVNGGVTYQPDEPTTHTVTFIDPITGEVIAEVEVEHGEAAEAPEAPAHDWHTFTGWDADFSEVTEDITVTAQYTEKGDLNGDGTVDMSDALKFMRWLIGTDEIACDETEVDFNGDGETNLMDALLLMRHVLGTI